jgi:hypothetical protein
VQDFSAIELGFMSKEPFRERSGESFRVEGIRCIELLRLSCVSLPYFKYGGRLTFRGIECRGDVAFEDSWYCVST